MIALQLNGEIDIASAIALFHENGLWLPTRTIYIGSQSSSEDGSVESGCDAKAAERVIKNLEILASISLEPIQVILNCVGGDPYHAWAIYDTLTRFPGEVTIYGTGYVMSCGAIILQAGDKRVLEPNATVMIHYGDTSASMSNTAVKEYLKQMEHQDTKMEYLFLNKIRQVRPPYQMSDLRQDLQRDTYLSAEEAVSLGLADEVAKPTKTKKTPSGQP